MKIEFDLRSSRRVIILALVLISAWMLALWLFEVLRHFLFILLLAWLLAVAMEPAILWFMRHGVKRRGVATAITGVCLGVLVLVTTYLFGRLFVEQVVNLVQSLPAVVSGVVDWINSTFHLSLNAQQILQNLQISQSSIASFAESIAGGVFGVAGSLGSVLVDLVTVVVFAFFFAGSGPLLLQAILQWLPPARQKVGRDIWQVTAAKTGGYVVSKVLLAAISTAFHGVFFLLIGVPSWLPMALLVGVTAQFVPMVGTYIGVAIPVLVSLYNDPLDAVWIILFASVYQQIETYFFTPRVSKRTMDVHPAIALAAVFIGAAIWGPLGAIIGIPLVAALIALIETYGHRYELSPEPPAAASAQ